LSELWKKQKKSPFYKTPCSFAIQLLNGFSNFCDVLTFLVVI